MINNTKFKTNQTNKKEKNNFVLKKYPKRQMSKIIKNEIYDLDLDISFENQSIFNDNELITEKSNIDSSKSVKNEIILKKDNKFNSEIQMLINYSNNPKELLKVVKFVSSKINFLYHIDLAFETNYKIKS